MAYAFTDAQLTDINNAVSQIGRMIIRRWLMTRFW